MKRFIFAAALTLAACSGPATPTVDTDLAIEVMQTLSSDTMEGRGVMTDGIVAARAYIIEQATALNNGVAPTEQRFARSVLRRDGTSRDVEGINLIVTLPGPSNDGPILEITAHYDHLGMTETGEIYNGADDNASGVGALLAILKSFQDVSPDHEVRLIWLDAEEVGLTGAREYVAATMDDRPRLNLNLDMIAQNEDGEIYASGTYHTPELKPVVKKIANSVDLTVRFGHDAPEDGPNDWTNLSDHAAFHEVGLPFIYLGVEDHPHYHKTTDTFATIPLDTYRQTVTLSVRLAHYLDDRLGTLAKARSTEP